MNPIIEFQLIQDIGGGLGGGLGEERTAWTTIGCSHVYIMESLGFHTDQRRKYWRWHTKSVLGAAKNG